MMQPDRTRRDTGPDDRTGEIDVMARRETRVYADDIHVAPRSEAHRDDDSRTLGDLFAELTQETRTLVRQEIELARTEATEKASKAAKNAGYIGAGGAVAYAGLIVFLMGVAYLLALIMPMGLATVIVGLLVMGLGYLFVQKGMHGLKKTDFTLHRTTTTLQEDKQWIKEQI